MRSLHKSDALEQFFQKIGLEKVIAEDTQLFLSIQETFVL